MDTLGNDTLASLLAIDARPCISIYLPTHRAGPEVQQDRVRYKNALRDAENQLRDRGFPAENAREFLAPATGLLNEQPFWQYQAEGLAVFIAPSILKTFRLPLSFQEAAIVGDRFYLKPLLTLFSNDGRFFVLALSATGVRLLQGSRYNVAEVMVEGIPSGIKEALGYDALEKQLQFHTRAPARAQGRDAQFHGHGAPGDRQKDDLRRYFRIVDEALHGVLVGEQAPLVLAGVDYLHSLYRDVNTYPHLSEIGIPGNPDDSSPEELHRRSWEIVGPGFQQPQQDAFSRFETLRRQGSPLASGDLAAIIPAAHAGRVDALFVASEKQRWGSFEAASAQVVVHEKRQPDDADLLDVAAVETMLKGGAVYVVKTEDVPGGGDAAAILRY